MSNKPRKIAVIGSGIAGLAAAHILQRTHHVTLFEKRNRLGGHTHTVTIPDGPDVGTPVDTGFIVMNHRNYPLLTRLFDELGVELRDAEMSFGYHDAPSGLQYCGAGLNGLFAQRSNLFRPAFYRMLRDIMRFLKLAEYDVIEGSIQDETLADYLERHEFGRAFIDHHIIPMGSAIWSTPCEEMMQFPAQSFLQFFRNHGLLSLSDRPQWKTVIGGSRDYIERMRASWKQVDIRLNAKIARIGRDHGVRILFHDRDEERFDQVLIATHADQALHLLVDPSEEEARSLGCWEYSRSRTLLHTDETVMPPLRNVWSSWNFTRLEGNQTCLTYYMNRLQGLETAHRYFVSLNLRDEPRNVIRSFDYEHPMFTRAALAQRPQLEQLNGSKQTWFAGSYFGNGFHEDAVRSGIRAANAMAALPGSDDPSAGLTDGVREEIVREG